MRCSRLLATTVSFCTKSFLLGSVALVIAPAARAMDMQKQGDQLILTGPIVETDYVRFNSLLTRDIKTVVLRNSVGGDLWTGLALGNTIKWHNLTTVASGYCFSSCALMFLGGKERYFSDEFEAGKTLVGIHSPYCPTGGGVHPSVRASAFRWIREQTEGHFDKAAFDRYQAELGDPSGGVLFFSAAPTGRNSSTLRCKGGFKPGTCTEVPELTAQAAGFVTDTTPFAVAKLAAPVAEEALVQTASHDEVTPTDYVGMARDPL